MSRSLAGLYLLQVVTLLHHGAFLLVLVQLLDTRLEQVYCAFGNWIGVIHTPVFATIFIDL